MIILNMSLVVVYYYNNTGCLAPCTGKKAANALFANAHMQANLRHMRSCILGRGGAGRDHVKLGTMPRQVKLHKTCVKLPIESSRTNQQECPTRIMRHCDGETTLQSVLVSETVFLFCDCMLWAGVPKHFLITFETILRSC